MNESGVYCIGLGMFVLAIFPLLVYGFFRFAVLDRKAQGIVQDLKASKAFQINSIAEKFKGPKDVEDHMAARYSFKRFRWPVLLLVLFNLICFSILWDILRQRFSTSGTVDRLFYPPQFVSAAELPMMAFLGVVIFNYTLMLRRLYVWDITTHLFWNALQRTWLVLIVALVAAASLSATVGTGPSDPSKWMGPHTLFFGLGFVVSSALRNIIQRAQDYFGVNRPKVEELSLALIQGINFWNEARLEEEGIENAQNLATCDILDLQIATRYNLRTLLDWVDQAILVHRLGLKARDLRDAGLISGAIDMAWAAPQNAAGDETLPREIADTLKIKPIYVIALMNSLFQDTQIRTLWLLWQSQLEALGANTYKDASTLEPVASSPIPEPAQA
jgi:hypothetical protein